jgi:hypothetical protein
MLSSINLHTVYADTSNTTVGRAVQRISLPLADGNAGRAYIVEHGVVSNGFASFDSTQASHFELYSEESFRENFKSEFVSPDKFVWGDMLVDGRGGHYLYVDENNIYRLSGGTKSSRSHWEETGQFTLKALTTRMSRRYHEVLSDGGVW